MENLTEVSYFDLTAYYGMEDHKPLYFVMFLVIYCSIIVENAMLIWLIYSERSLHKPMFFLLCNLAVNGLFGGTALLPAVLHNIMSTYPSIPLALCQVQIYAVHMYAIVEFTILAAMSYDRYIAIGNPLLYQVVMSQRLYKLIIFTWLYPMIAFLIVFGFTLNLRFCHRVIEKVYCVNYMLVKLACSDTTVVNIVGLLSVAVYALPQIILILYTYGHIMKMCLFSSSKSKVKALRTCVPHLLALLNYCVGCFFEIAQSRFNTDHLSTQTKMFMSLYFLIFPPILNPVIYGLSIQAIRLRLFRRKRGQLQSS